MEQLTNKYRILQTPVVPVLLALGVFFPALFNGFVNWDDPAYIINNTLLRDGSLSGLAKLFTTAQLEGNYHPITLLSLALDYRVGGLNPLVYHATNIVLHALCTFVVFRLFDRVSGSKAVALIVAVLFAVHPMQVEAVAWATGRKDLLHALFMLVSMVWWLRFRDTSKPRLAYTLSLVFFVLAVLSKGVAMVLPGFLILLDLYQQRKDYGRMLLEKVPFVAISVVAAWLAVSGQQTVGALAETPTTPIGNSLLIGAYNLCWQAYKIVVPGQLSSFHPYTFDPTTTLPWYFFAAGGIAVAIAAAVIWRLRTNRTTTLGVGLFFVALLPVIQLIPVGMALSAERYAYIAMLGLLFLLAHWLLRWERSKARWLVPAMLLVLVATWSVVTIQRVGVWKNGGTLWGNVLEQYPDNHYALYNLGHFQFKQGNTPEALANVAASIEQHQQFAPAFILRAQLVESKAPQAALSDYNAALAIEPGNTQALLNRALLLFSAMNETDRAIADLLHCIHIDPTYELAYLNLGAMLERGGQTKEAASVYTTLIKELPNSIRGWQFRGLAHMQLGDPNAAMQDYSKALELNPGNARIWHLKSVAAMEAGNDAEATHAGKQASKLGYSDKK